MEWKHYKLRTLRLASPEALPCPACGLHHGQILDAKLVGVPGKRAVHVTLECELGDRWTLRIGLDNDSCISLSAEVNESR